jgi:hypothetical protein
MVRSNFGGYAMCAVLRGVVKGKTGDMNGWRE